MANQLGSLVVAPREYNAHQRHAKLARQRYSGKVKAGQLGAFLQYQATRLTLTTAQVFAKVTKYGAARVKGAATSSLIP